MDRFSAFAAIVALLSSAAVQAKDSQMEVLKPVTPWDLNYGSNSCRLVRMFGTNEQRVVFYVEKYGISSGFTVLIAGKSISNVINQDSALRFSNGGGAGGLTEGTFGAFGPSVVSTSGTFNPKVLTLTEDQDKLRPSSHSRREKNDDPPKFDPLTPAELHDITWVQLSRGIHSVRLMTGPWDKTVAALDKCVDDLVRSWGVDPKQLKTIKHGPTMASNSSKKVVQKIAGHYPDQAFAHGAQANLSVRLTIDTSGDVKSCELTDITDAKDFDDYPCEVFKKYAKFSPAIDAEGKAVKSIYRTKIFYRIG